VCQRAGVLIGWDVNAKRALVVRADCDSWNCAECCGRMAEKWALRAEMGARQILRAGETLDFVTITSHEKLPDFASTERVWRLAWAKLYSALKRKKNNLQYMIVPEKHKDGRMHVHALWNANVSQKWLKDNARKRGLGYQCKVIHVPHSGRAQKYVVKYVGKDLGTDTPAHFRRVRVSHDWADLPAPNSPTQGLTWEYIGSNGALAVVLDECQAKRISLIDAETGEYWDAVDLGTISTYA